MLTAREHVDEINRLRFAKDVIAVQQLALDIWADWKAERLADPVGLGAVCQVAFVNAVDATALEDAPPEDPIHDVAASAQLWRARASLAAVMNGEINTAAMLMAPMAMQAMAQGHPEAALGIFKELAFAAEEIERRGLEDSPGIPLGVLRRASYEKQGWVLWRVGRYVEALRAYEGALPHTSNVSRDRIRVEAGLLLASLGIEEDELGSFDRAQAVRRFRDLEARAQEGQWKDVAVRLRANVDRIEQEDMTGVQDLTPMEIE